MLLRITWPRSLAFSIALPSSGGCPDCLFPIFNRVSVSRTVTIDRTSLLWTDPAFDCHLTRNRVPHVKQSRINHPPPYQGHPADTLLPHIKRARFPHQHGHPVPPPAA